MQSRQRIAVVVWEGEYKNDGLERLRYIISALPALHSPALVGEPGNWRIVADAEDRNEF